MSFATIDARGVAYEPPRCLVSHSSSACLLSGLLPARSRRSRCADCHYAQSQRPGAGPPVRLGPVSARAQQRGLREVPRRQQHRVRVDASRIAAFSTPGNKKSPVNRANLPATCGGCHVGPFVAFQDSRHYQLLKSGDEHGPTCSTCHDAVAGQSAVAERAREAVLALPRPEGSRAEGASARGMRASCTRA